MICSLRWEYLTGEAAVSSLSILAAWWYHALEQAEDAYHRLGSLMERSANALSDAQTREGSIWRAVRLHFSLMHGVLEQRTSGSLPAARAMACPLRAAGSI